MYAPNPLVFANLTQSFTGTPANPGTAITLGTSNTPGTAVAVIGTALAHDCELLEVVINSAAGTALSATDTSAFVDILIDRAGGTTWDTTNILIEGLMCGFMTASASGQYHCRRFLFPVWLPAGSTLAARGQSMTASGSGLVVEVSINVYGGVSHPSRYWCGTKIDAIGLTRATSKGTSLTPGATNVFGSWTSIGSVTTSRYGLLIPSINPGSNNISNYTQLEIGYSSTKLGLTFNASYNTTEYSSSIFEYQNIYGIIPEGTQLQGRVRSSGSTSIHQAIIHGVY